MKVVATYRGNDSGGGCPCTTPPTSLSPGVGTVYVNNVQVMANGDVLSPAEGKTCTDPPLPCSSTRIVVSSSNVFVDGVPIAHIGDYLNQGTGIKIVSVSSNVYAK